MRPTDYNDKPESGSSKQHTREQLPVDPVLDRMEDHEGENKPEQEQQQGSQQRMPQTAVETLAQPNHGSMVDEAPDFESETTADVPARFRV